MVEFRYKIIDKLERLFYLIICLGVLTWDFFSTVLPPSMALIIISILLIISIVYSEILTTKFQINDQGLVVKQWLRKEKKIAFDDILNMYIHGRGNNEETVTLILYNKEDIRIELIKLNQSILFLELMDSAGIKRKRIK